MKSKRIYQLIAIIIVLGICFLLIRNNVTATKEKTTVEEGMSKSATPLEINSEIVQNVFNKLTFIEDDIKDDRYKNFSYNFDGLDKEITDEEKLYSIIGNIYSNEQYLTSFENDIYTISITKEELSKEGNNLYEKIDLETLSFDYETNKKCGIMSYEDMGNALDIKIKKCDDKRSITKSELVGAVKDGNFIKIQIKAFEAYTSKNKIDEYKEIYSVRNFYDDKILLKSSYHTLMGDTKDIFDNYDVDTYVFSFELKGDQYFLAKIEREKRD